MNRRMIKRKTYFRWCMENGYSHLFADYLNKERRRNWFYQHGKIKEFPENHINNKREYYRKEYLKSEHWKNLRLAKLKETPYCEKCNKRHYLDVHHLDYKNLYDVLLSDLQVLCRKCHKKEHPQEKRRRQRKYYLKFTPRYRGKKGQPLNIL